MSGNRPSEVRDLGEQDPAEKSIYKTDEWPRGCTGVNTGTEAMELVS